MIDLLPTQRDRYGYIHGSFGASMSLSNMSAIVIGRGRADLQRLTCCAPRGRRRTHRPVIGAVPGATGTKLTDVLLLAQQLAAGAVRACRGWVGDYRRTPGRRPHARGVGRATRIAGPPRSPRPTQSGRRICALSSSRNRLGASPSTCCVATPTSRWTSQTKFRPVRRRTAGAEGLLQRQLWRLRTGHRRRAGRKRSAPLCRRPQFEG